MGTHTHIDYAAQSCLCLFPDKSGKTCQTGILTILFEDIRDIQPIFRPKISALTCNSLGAIMSNLPYMVI
jgi:hypothetical protein